MTTPRHRHRGASLIEMIAVIIILAVIAPVIAGVLTQTSRQFTVARDQRAAIDDATHAIDQAALVLRNALAQEGVTLADGGHHWLRLSDGTELRRRSDRVTLDRPDLPEADLITGVTDARVSYADDAGQPIGLDSGLFPQAVARIGLEITARGLTVSSSVYLASRRAFTPPPSSIAWHETFEDLSNGDRSDDGDTAWTTDDSRTRNARHGVHSGAYRFSRMRPFQASVDWRSEPINIAGSAAAIRIRMRGSGTLNHESTSRFFDYYDIYAVVDGNERHLARVTGDPTGETIQYSGITGNALEVLVRAGVTGGDEYIYLDDVMVLASPEEGGTFAEASNYVIFASDDVFVEGAQPRSRVVAGRNANIRQSTVGGGLGGVALPQDTMLIGAALTLDSSQVLNGDVRTGTTSHLHGHSVPQGQIIVGEELPVDLDVLTDTLELAAQRVDAAEAITAEPDAGGLTLQATGSGVNVFAFDASVLRTLHTLRIEGPQTASVVVRIDGSNAEFRNGRVELIGVDARRVLWVAPEADRVTLAFAEWRGTVLAPHAEVVIEHLTAFGAAFGRRVTLRQGSLYHEPYEGSLPRPQPQGGGS